MIQFLLAHAEPSQCRLDGPAIGDDIDRLPFEQKSDRRVAEGEPVHEGVEPDQREGADSPANERIIVADDGVCTTFDSRNITTKSKVFDAPIERLPIIRKISSISA